MATILQFSPFASNITPEFWTTFTKLKIDSLKLSEDPIPVHGSYQAGKTLLDRETGQQLSLGTSLHFGQDSFDAAPRQKRDECIVAGQLLNFNTIESFKQADKPALFQARAQALWKVVTESEAPKASELNTLFVITFAELKKYAFYHWFSFPAFMAKPPWQLETSWKRVAEAFTEEKSRMIAEGYAAFGERYGSEETHAMLLREGGNSGFESAPLCEATDFFANVPEEQRTLLFLDPSSDPTAPGWPLRNFLAYLAARHRIKRLRIICWRATLQESLTSIVSLESAEVYNITSLSAVGWEKNQAGKLAPRVADLGGLMDPRRLADQAVDLNLKLMRWRILPALDLDKIKHTKCLLLGAGTLGCYVARNLMAWGVSKITLVDSGKVSYSNPVRQPLFEFTDCLDGGKPKAVCAAESLKRIYPSVDANGLELAIPMPGHPIPPTGIDASKKAVQDLERLMSEHDVTYLLMDSRESRWLPTLIGAATGKLVMNAALGFDSYLVMRHGMLDQPLQQRLGCYYCNDIVAPMDSLSDRTLDQMCTVTRPGLAAMASATAVELMASVLQHPDGAHAPSEVDRSGKSVLGAAPHQIRGFLADFNTMKITGQAYSNCTACSEKIVAAYRKDGFEMLRKAFDDAKYLEEVTGLDKLQAETDAVLEAVDWDEEDDEHGM